MCVNFLMVIPFFYSSHSWIIRIRICTLNDSGNFCEIPSRSTAQSRRLQKKRPQLENSLQKQCHSCCGRMQWQETSLTRRNLVHIHCTRLSSLLLWVIMHIHKHTPNVERETGNVLFELEGDSHGTNGSFINEGLSSNACGQNVFL